MAFLDELNKRVNGLAQSAQKTAEVAKLQHQISQKQAEFDSLYHQIGQMYYACRQRGVQPDDSIDTLCDRVTAAAQEIEVIRGKIDEIRNVARCAACGKEVSRDARFCPNCGAKIEQKQAEPAPAEEAPAEETPAEAEAEAPAEEKKSVVISWPETNAEEKAEETAEETAEDKTEE